MEDIKGIRKLSQGQWSRQETPLKAQLVELPTSYREIEYKARWEGIPATYVTAGGTSKCSMRGSKTFPNEDRTLHCPRCKTPVDRDVNAARNILAKGALRFGADGFVRGEGERGGDSNPPSRCESVDFRGNGMSRRVDRS
jgi:hypothetical protein